MLLYSELARSNSREKNPLYTTEQNHTGFVSGISLKAMKSKGDGLVKVRSEMLQQKRTTGKLKHISI